MIGKKRLQCVDTQTETEGLVSLNATFRWSMNVWLLKTAAKSSSLPLW
jgi:hypothetical protein